MEFKGHGVHPSPSLDLTYIGTVVYTSHDNTCPLFFRHYYRDMCVYVFRTSLLQTYNFLLVLSSVTRKDTYIKMTLLLSEVTSGCVLNGTQSWELSSPFNLLPLQEAIEAIKLYSRYIASDYNEVCQNECLASISGPCPELFIFTYKVAWEYLIPWVVIHMSL